MPHRRRFQTHAHVRPARVGEQKRPGCCSPRMPRYFTAVSSITERAKARCLPINTAANNVAMSSKKFSRFPMSRRQSARRVALDRRSTFRRCSDRSASVSKELGSTRTITAPRKRRPPTAHRVLTREPHHRRANPRQKRSHPRATPPKATHPRATPPKATPPHRVPRRHRRTDDNTLIAAR